MITTLTLFAVLSQQLITDFSPDSPVAWTTIHDTVMGGRSSGEISQSSEETLIFEGNVSLKNNGGFVSARTIRPIQQLSQSDGIEIRIKGSGRTYQFSCSHKDIPLRGGGYWQSFDTLDSEWSTIQLPWGKFKATSFGMDLSQLPELKAEDVSGLAIYLYDKKSGPFSLEIDYIKTYRDSLDSSPSTIADYLGAEHPTLLALLGASDLDSAVASFDVGTIFAPTEEAFAKLPAELVNALLLPENKENLQSILLSHVVQETKTVFNSIGEVLVSLSENTISVEWGNSDKDFISIGAGRLVGGDVLIGGLVVHAISDVIIPENFSLNSDESIQSIGAFLSSAISEGVPVFNRGDVQECADIYQNALVKLSEFDGLIIRDRDEILDVLQQESRVNAQEAAWIYRREIDRLLRIYG
jgi:NADH dehydrogenase [ubiquinone] 1 alpha subcomplex assembly factor 1